MKSQLLVLLLLFPALAFGQADYRYDKIVIGHTGQAIPLASIAVCNQPATTSTTPCSTLATLYPDSGAKNYLISTISCSNDLVTVSTSTSNTIPVNQWVVISGVTNTAFDGTFHVTSSTLTGTFTYAQACTNGPSSGGTVSAANPTFSDGLGNYFFYAATGAYTVQVYWNITNTMVFPDQFVGQPSPLGNTSTGTNTFSGTMNLNNGGALKHSFSGPATLTDSATAAGKNSLKIYSLDGIQLRDGNQYSTINHVYSALPTTGGFIDDSGGNLAASTYSSNPFPTSQTPSTLLLGAKTYKTTATWILPQSITLKGLSSPTLSSQGGTIIQAQSGFPSSSNVLQTPNATTINGTAIEKLTVDCNGQSGATGVQWFDNQEESGLQHFNVIGCAGIGVLIGDGTAGHSQNAGPFDDLYVSSGSTSIPTPSTVGIKVDIGDSEIRGIRGATVNFTGATTMPTNCIVINGGGDYKDLHVEGCTNGINVSATTHHSVTLEHIDCSSNVANCVTITSGVVHIIDVSCGGTNFINDTVTGNVLPCSTGVLREYPTPTFTFGGFYSGALTTKTSWIASFTPVQAITVNLMVANVQKAAVGCGTFPVITLTNGTVSQKLTLGTGNATSTGIISKSFPAGTAIQIELTTAASGCSTSPQNLNLVVQYQMQ